MRSIARVQSEKVAAALNAKRRNRLTETEWAIWWYANTPPNLNPLPAKPAKAPAFSAYKAPAVLEALEKMFEYKCAYCESRYAHLMPTDVEHYRPKAEWRDEQGNLGKPGYYWLAADWDNLLGSCADCNRERNQTRRTADGIVVKVKSGKANSFPLAAGSPRWTNPAVRTNERPLLLNPCNDNPDHHLHFAFDGFVAAKQTPQEATMAKGRTTIDVCGLARDLLVTYRRDQLALFVDAICRVCACEVFLARMPGDQFSINQLAQAKAAVQSQVQSTQEYLAAKLTLLRLFDLLNPEVAAYRTALAAWEDDTANAQRLADLKDVVARIKGIADSDLLNRSFVEKLLQNWAIPQLP